MNEHPDFPGIEEEIPAGLAYKEAYWDAALLKIKAREAFIFRLRLAVGLSVALLLLLGSAGWYYWTPADAQLAFAHEVVSGTQVRLINEDNVNSEGLQAQASTVLAVQQALQAEQSNSDEVDEVTADSEASILAAVEQSSSTNSENSTESQPQGETVEERSATDSATEPIAGLSTVESEADESTTTTQAGISTVEPESSEAQVDMDNPVVSGESMTTQESDAQGSSAIDVGEAEYSSSKTANEIDIPSKDATAKELMIAYNASEERAVMHSDFTPLPRNNNISIPTVKVKADKPAGVHVDIKPQKILPPLKPFNVQVLMGSSFRTEFGSAKEVTAFNPMVGLAADYNFNRRWSVNADLHYFSIKGTERPFSTEYTTLDVVRKTITMSVETSKLHYVSLPITGAVRLGHRTQLRAGGGISILAQSENVLTVTEEVNGITTLQEEYREDGYTSGFNSVNTYLSVGMNYYITGNTTWGLSYQYGLSDVTRNDFFGDDGFDRNSRLSAYVRFNVF